MSRVFQFVARRKFRPTGTSHADAIFDDTGSDVVILAARRIHKKFCFKFYIDLPRTPRAPRQSRNSALNLPRAATLPPLYDFTAHYGGRQARLNLPCLNAGGRILPEICRRSLALCNGRRNFVLNFKRHIKNTITLYNPAHRSIGHAPSGPNRANNEIKNKGEAMSKAVLHSVLAIEAILWGLLSAVIIGA